MSKRNFVLLIIILITVVIAILGFLYFRTSPATPADSGTGTNFFSQFNPFGVSKPTPPPVKPPADVSGYEPVPSETEIQKLTKVSGMPIAGFTVFIKERLKDVPATTPAIKPLTEFIPTLRYVEKATGNIYQTFVDKIEERKYSKTIIPKVYEAYFGNRGEIVVMRYLKTDDRTIETFVGNLPKEYLGESINTLREVKGYFLPNDIKDISVSPDTSKIFYLFNLSDNNIIGATLNFSDNNKMALYGNNSLSLYIYSTDNGNSDILGVKTLPEKCVWGKANDFIYCAVPKFIDVGKYPDAWYQGEVSFSDQFWKIDAKNRNASLILDPAIIVGGEEIDGIKLALDGNENYLFFVNKKDS